MGYDFKPKNEEAGYFHLGAFSWPVLLEQFGTLYPTIQHGGQFYTVGGVDSRIEGEYPAIVSNDGFEVYEDEARIMARMARNYVAIQRSLPEEQRSTALVHKEGGIVKDDLEKVLIAAMNGTTPDEVWPQKIRDDFTDKFEQFAEWAERSGGFYIY